jgi:hypothetical protein
MFITLTKGKKEITAQLTGIKTDADEKTNEITLVEFNLSNGETATIYQKKVVDRFGSLSFSEYDSMTLHVDNGKLHNEMTFTFETKGNGLVPVGPDLSDTSFPIRERTWEIFLDNVKFEWERNR